MSCALLAVGLLALLGWLALRLVPLPPALFALPVSEIEFLDRNGRPLRIVRPEDIPFGHPLAYADIPRSLIEATLAAEDRRFWSHHGVDWRATLRAAWQLAVNRRVVSGGSTITQQLIKLGEPRPRTLRTKFIEAFQALRLEQVWDKQRILAEYLSRLDYGNFNRGAAAAAKFYFDKPLPDLSPAECALLAALPQAPSRLNPCTHLGRARKRQQWILNRMQDAGWLTAQELRRASCEPADLAQPRRVFEAPHFIDLLLSSSGAVLRNDITPNGFANWTPEPATPDLAKTRKRLLPLPGGEGWGEDRLYSCSLRSGVPAPPIRTTLDLELNHFAERTLRAHLLNLQAQHVSNGAVVMIENHTGDVLALVGSEDYFSAAAGQVNGAWAPRSPGSSLKPFTYLLALERGATPASVVADVPTEFATATGLFAPVNYNRHCYGPMRYRLALANSLNISAVNVLASVGGPGPLQHLLQQCGLSTLNRPAEQYGLGLAIGNAEARLLELANAYACLARLGEYRPYRLLASARDGPLPRGPGFAGRDVKSAIRIADAADTYLIADILSDNEARSLAFGAESSLHFDFPVACKTGTSSDFRDNWAFGYTPEFTVGVWIGNADSSPMQNVSGVTGAAPILHDLFEQLHERFGTTWYSPTTNIVERWINPLTGKRLREPEPLWTAGAIQEKFDAQNIPPLESPDDYATLSNSKRAVRLSGEYRDWLATGDNWVGERAVLSGTADSLRIQFPPPGTTLYLDADLPQAGRRMLLRAAGPEPLEWRSDSLSLAREGNREIALLTEGHHCITVRDPASGAEARTWIEVRVR